MKKWKWNENNLEIIQWYTFQLIWFFFKKRGKHPYFEEWKVKVEWGLEFC